MRLCLSRRWIASFAAISARWPRRRSGRIEKWARMRSGVYPHRKPAPGSNSCGTTDWTPSGSRTVRNRIWWIFSFLARPISTSSRCIAISRRMRVILPKSKPNISANFAVTNFIARNWIRQCDVYPFDWLLDLVPSKLYCVGLIDWLSDWLIDCPD